MRYLICIGALLFSLLLCCNDNHVNPVSFVDSYTPQLLSSKGTVYNENYFPLQSQFSFEYQGAAQYDRRSSA